MEPECINGLKPMICRWEADDTWRVDPGAAVADKPRCIDRETFVAKPGPYQCGMTAAIPSAMGSILTVGFGPGSRRLAHRPPSGRHKCRFRGRVDVGLRVANVPQQPRSVWCDQIEVTEIGSKPHRIAGQQAISRHPCVGTDQEIRER